MIVVITCGYLVYLEKHEELESLNSLIGHNIQTNRVGFSVPIINAVIVGNILVERIGRSARFVILVVKLLLQKNLLLVVELLLQKIMIEKMIMKIILLWSKI